MVRCGVVRPGRARQGREIIREGCSFEENFGKGDL